MGFDKNDPDGPILAKIPIFSGEVLVENTDMDNEGDNNSNYFASLLITSYLGGSDVPFRQCIIIISFPVRPLKS